MDFKKTAYLTLCLKPTLKHSPTILAWVKLIKKAPVRQSQRVELKHGWGGVISLYQHLT